MKTAKVVSVLGVALVASIMIAGLVLTTGLVFHANSSAANTSTPACAYGTDAACAKTGLAFTHPQAITPDLGPTYNSLVTPYASFTGPYSYVAAGAAMRDTGSGYINLAWSGGLVKAFMVWSIMDDSVPAQTATINGHDVTGTWVAFASPSPCWSPTYIYEMVADVTAYVTNGNNTLTNFPSGITTGADPWASAQIDPMLEGASLVVVNQSAGPGIHQVTLYTGAQTIYTAFGSITAPLNYTAATSTGATTTYVVSDGQLPGNSAGWNGATIDSNAFPGSDPKDTPFTWSVRQPLRHQDLQRKRRTRQHFHACVDRGGNRLPHLGCSSPERRRGALRGPLHR